MRIEIGTDCPALADGFHQDEGSHRWTDGHAALPRKMLVAFTGEIIAEVRRDEERYSTELLTPPTCSPVVVSCTQTTQISSALRRSTYPQVWAKHRLTMLLSQYETVATWHTQHRESRDRLDRLADGITEFIGSAVRIILHTGHFHSVVSRAFEHRAAHARGSTGSDLSLPAPLTPEQCAGRPRPAPRRGGLPDEHGSGQPA